MILRVLLAAAGLLITLAGVIFALQGVGVIGGSFMSGTTVWAVAARSSPWPAWPSSRPPSGGHGHGRSRPRAQDRGSLLPAGGQ